MRPDLSVGELEEKVKQVRHSLDKLIGPLGKAKKPVALRPYGAADLTAVEFDNEEGPPWEGEWDNTGGG